MMVTVLGNTFKDLVREQNVEFFFFPEEIVESFYQTHCEVR